MTNVVTDRRLSGRFSIAYPVAVHDRRGHLLVKGRTANISESGLFAIFPSRTGLPQECLVKLILPSASAETSRRAKSRTVLYSARIVRTQQAGGLMGLGIELMDKIR